MVVDIEVSIFTQFCTHFLLCFCHFFCCITSLLGALRIIWLLTRENKYFISNIYLNQQILVQIFQTFLN
jgi:hypothetical protein